MGRPLIDITGRRFGHLVVIHRVRDRFAGKTKHQEVWYRVQCDCGRRKSMRGYMLRHNRVHQCGHLRGVRHGMYGTKEYSMWNGVKYRADQTGVLFKLILADIKIPKRCPLLGIRLVLDNKKTSYNSPSLDRIDSRKGYVKNNVWVISHKANTIKSNATLSELKRLVNNLEAR